MTKVVEWFGFKLHLRADVKHEVSLAYKITGTSAGDGETLAAILEDAHTAAIPTSRGPRPAIRDREKIQNFARLPKAVVRSLSPLSPEYRGEGNQCALLSRAKFWLPSPWRGRRGRNGEGRNGDTQPFADEGRNGETGTASFPNLCERRENTGWERSTHPTKSP